MSSTSSSKTDDPQRQRLKILTFVRYYLPGYKSGGPIQSIANLVEHLGNELEFLIVTTDRDAFDSKAYMNIVVDDWNIVSKARVYYASPQSLTFAALLKIIKEIPYDVLYLNSFFDPIFTIYPLLAQTLRFIPLKPVVIAPRGELSKEALAIKAWKKIPYLAAIRFFGIYRNICWQASSKYEAKNIHQTLGRFAMQIKVASDFSSPMKIRGVPTMAIQGENSDLRIVFLSRITPMKNLYFALKVISRVTSKVRFDIWGIIDDQKYWDKCKKNIRFMPDNIDVSYRGVAEHSKVIEILSGYDLFFLPTRGENYGHAIAEALTAGIPVLISNQTPWKNLEAEGVGWDLPIDKGEELFVNAIQRVAEMNTREKMFVRQKIVAYTDRHLADSTILEANRRLFILSSRNVTNK